MHALVTGGAGFIGSHLCEAPLSKQSWSVTIFGNFSSDLKQSIQQLLNEKPETVRLCEGNCTDPQCVRKSLKDVDVIFHFAANPEIRLELCDPL